MGNKGREVQIGFNFYVLVCPFFQKYALAENVQSGKCGRKTAVLPSNMSKAAGRAARAARSRRVTMH